MLVEKKWLKVKNFFLKINKRGIGTIVRPLFFEFYSDETLFEKRVLNRQFLIGKSLLVTPVLEEFTESIFPYFPRGKW